MFKGSSYASRDTSYDTTYILSRNVEFYNVSFGQNNEIVFDKLTGAAVESGTISLRHKTDTSVNKAVSVSDTGTIGFSIQSVSDTSRVKDSRHIQFDYSRNINTATENVVLNFDNTVTESIPIGQNLVSGQFYWQGTVLVGGSNQTVEIKTFHLNNSGTQFDIHRDGRYNNKILKASLSGDASGYLVNYSADGLTTTHTSSYISNFAWQ